MCDQRGRIPRYARNDKPRCNCTSLPMRKCGKPETNMPQAAANGIQLEYETLGDPAHPAILLIMGLGWQMVMWPQEFCEALARAGFYVIRYDNRDVGLSTKLHGLGKVRLMRAGV